MVKGVVVLSGGMDSTVTLYKALREVDDVCAISFNYGQRHKRELKAAIKTCKELGINHEIVNISGIQKVMLNNSLTTTMNVPEGHYQEESMKQTVVPSRNLIFASIASAYAISIKAESIYLGVHAGDHAIYPDCRPTFIYALRNILNKANYEKVNVRTPYIKVDKKTIVKDGLRMNVNFKNTWTCYNGRKKACGKCGSCQERLEAFKHNNVKDPIKYEEEN